MIEKQLKQNDGTKRQMRNGGLFSTKEKRVIPGPRYATSGNVTMSTNGATYRFPNPYEATQVMFYGIASRLTTAGFTLTCNTISSIPANGTVYELSTNTDLKIVITGFSGSTTIFALATNPDFPTPTSGTYNLVSGSGSAVIVVTGVSAPTTDIRADVFGVAQLRPSYYFKPQSSVSVAVAKDVQKIIQSGKWFLIVDENAIGTAPEYRARAVETVITNIDWPSSNDIVVRAEVVDYGPDYFDVKVALATNWQLVGNFVCT